MCSYCGDVALDAELQGLDAIRMWELARQFEAGLDGEPASDADWAIFTGRATGAIGYRALTRLSLGRRQAVSAMKGGNSNSGFRCEAVA